MPSRFSFFRKGGFIYLCYIDESGTSAIPGNTSHFVLAGLAIPIWHWRMYESKISEIKKKYNLSDAEIHTAWILRPYPEQRKIDNFDSLSHEQRRAQVVIQRDSILTKLQGNIPNQKNHKKNFKKTESYIHLSHGERKQFIEDIAREINSWGSTRLFAECINKNHFDPTIKNRSVDEQAFEQVVSRFETFLENTGKNRDSQNWGILIHDRNETHAKKHTKLMIDFHRNGTFWTTIKNIIETPLFVDSELTSMVQVADLCSYAIRRYLENGEEALFDLIFERGDRSGNRTVGIRHYTERSCQCKICSSHR